MDNQALGRAVRPSKNVRPAMVGIPRLWDSMSDESRHIALSGTAAIVRNVARMEAEPTRNTREQEDTEVREECVPLDDADHILTEELASLDKEKKRSATDKRGATRIGSVLSSLAARPSGLNRTAKRRGCTSSRWRARGRTD